MGGPAEGVRRRGEGRKKGPKGAPPPRQLKKKKRNVKRNREAIEAQEKEAERKEKEKRQRLKRKKTQNRTHKDFFLVLPPVLFFQFRMPIFYFVPVLFLLSRFFVPFAFFCPVVTMRGGLSLNWPKWQTPSRDLGESDPACACGW